MIVDLSLDLEAANENRESILKHVAEVTEKMTN